MVRYVVLTERAKKDLKRVPEYISRKLYDWAQQVEANGLENVRKIKGFHDEPLRG